MSYRDCILRVAQAAGRELSEKEIASIFERVHKAALDIKAGRTDIKTGDMFDDVVRQAAKRAADDLIHEAAVKQRQAQLQVAKLGARMGDAEVMRAAGIAPLEAVERTIRRSYDGKTNVESMEQRVAGHKAYFGRRLVETWTALGDDFLGFFQNKEKLHALVRELRGENSGDALARKGAEAFRNTAEEARQVFNQAGGDVGKLDDWGMPQHHSQLRVAQAGRDAWVETVLPMLDRGRYIDDIGRSWDDARLREFLGKAWDTIATNGHANSEPGQYAGAGKRANRHAESRQIHFKDADSVINYWQAFGERTAADILIGHVDTMARDIAFLEHFGPNPDITYRTMRDAALKAATMADPVKTASLEGRAHKLDLLYDYAAGRTKPTANAAVSGTADAIAQLNVAGKLGGAMWASLFGDKVLMETVSHLNNLPLLQRWRTELATLNPANAADRRLLQQQGLMLEGVRGGLNRFYEGLGQTGLTGKLANAVMRVSGMNAINEMRKGAFGASLFSAIGNEIAAGKGFKDLADSDIRTLKHYGITADDWAIWQKAKLQDIGHGNANALTPEAISRIPDADIAAVAAPNIQAMKDRAHADITELTRRNVQENKWLNGRMTRIQEAEARAADRLNRFMSTRDARLRKAGEWFQAQKEMIQAKVDLAEAQADIDAYLLQQKSRNQMTDAVIDLITKRNPERSVERVLRESDKRGDAFSRQRGNIGESLGERRGSAERRIVELDARLRQMERDADAAIKAKYEELSNGVDAQWKELDGWIERMKERTTRRDFVIDRIAREIPTREVELTAKARRDAIVKLLGAVNTESEFAIVTPGWKERAAFYGDLQRGTVKGEIARSALQFKSFPWAQFQRMMDAVANKEGYVGKSAMTASLIVGSTVAGAMIMQVRDMLSGKDPRDMTDWKFWPAAFLQGGALGIYGDFMYGASNTRYGSGPVEVLAGPTIGPLLEMGLVQPLQAVKKTMEGRETHLAAQTLQDVKGFVPGNNLWYTKAATDHLIMQQVMEQLSPGYLSSIRSRTQREYGQDWWWTPGQAAPDRAPDLKAAIGE